MSKPEAANEGMSATQKRNYALLLAAGMLVTGTMNTLFTKFQSLQSFECADPANPYDCDKCPEDAPDGTCVPFEQPVLQTFTMFLGEFICFIVYYILRYFNKRKAAQAGTVYDDGNMLVGYVHHRPRRAHLDLHACLFPSIPAPTSAPGPSGPRARPLASP
ncbi:hypothetical protein H696_03966 [Fonticula alba]|uniref:Uncharacterized protein n=1 Tax=Fonticula alba TaxID=691883 RepID=A0A058Z5M4_FONAL|nr:hypothetical protein H696_03966 [Fonticula alba]KCV69545.1 hypothetical protein H696_03966 [Fonticula alba]|eukprot:XP_009496110.1 hypothetical protein H696_03966 [Fonticula alba]